MGFTLDGRIFAKLVFALQQEKERIVLTIDRTNWRFKESNINIFMLGVAYKGITFSLLLTMLYKKGNSNSAESIALVRLFAKDCTECLVAESELVGEMDGLPQR